jgi:transposase
MPQPTPIPVRQLAFELWQKGSSAPEIAERLGLPARTVWELLKRFRERGADGITPSYRSAPKSSTPQQEEHRQRAELLRREHPTWGAELIRVVLGPLEATRAPTARTLRRWFTAAGLGAAPRGRRSRSRSVSRAGHPHAVWQMDACEAVRLESGARVSWLRVVDEFTGAVLGTRVFPLGMLEPGRG